MNKKEFIGKLEANLQQIHEKERKEILYDYEEHFIAGMEAGKTEDEIAESLGSPESISAELLLENGLQNEDVFSPVGKNADVPQSGGIGRGILVAIGLLLFNLIVMAGPFFGLLGGLVGLYAAAAGLILSPVALLFGIRFGNIETGGIEALFALMMTVGVGLMLAVGLFYLTKGFYFLTSRYIIFNVRLIKGRVS